MEVIKTTWHLLPICVRRKIGEVIFKIRIMKKYKTIVSDKFEYHDRFKSEIEYLKKRKRIEVFPYDFIEKYDGKKGEACYDATLKRYYVILENGRKLYFKKTFSKGEAEKYIIGLMIEQDEASPHRYFTDSFYPNGGIFCDVGAAEGKEALECYDQVEELFLFECEKEWVDALKYSFPDGKSHVIEKYVDKETDEKKHKIKIDDVLTNLDIPIFIKMDVEGGEYDVLAGMEGVLKKAKDIQVAVAVYHTRDGADKCKNYLEKLGFECEYSDGYMLFIYEDPIRNFVSPYFRHGVIRAKKYER